MVPGMPVFGTRRESVEYRRLGRTNLQVSVVGFGSLSIGLASTEQHRVTRLLNQALDGGLNMIDTAECYGHPDKNHAEILIGNAIGSRREEYVLGSKVGHEKGHFGQGSDWSAASVLRTIERSLQRLKTDYLDIVFLHGCSVEVLRAGEVSAALKKARKVFDGQRDQTGAFVISVLRDDQRTTLSRVFHLARHMKTRNNGKIPSHCPSGD